MGITKFEFHLIGHYFLFETNFFSFKGMLTFKQNKTVNGQLLRLATWFAKYSFEIKHIKGKQNVIPDFLSRPSCDSINTALKPLCKGTKVILFIHTMASSSSSIPVSQHLSLKMNQKSLKAGNHKKKLSNKPQNFSPTSSEI